MNVAIQIEAHKLRQTLYRSDLRHFVCLPADTVETVLGRTAGLADNLYLTCDADTDQVTCGLRTIWRTGGRAACAYCMAVTAFPTGGEKAILEHGFGMAPVAARRG